DGELHGQIVARLAARGVAGRLVDCGGLAIRTRGGVEARRGVGVLVEPEADRVLRCQRAELLLSGGVLPRRPKNLYTFPVAIMRSHSIGPPVSPSPMPEA